MSEVPQPSNIPSQKYKDNYESIFGKQDKRVESGTFAMVDGKMTRVDSGHGVERSSRSAISEKNPLTSKALAVHPDQAKQFNESAKKDGTGARYAANGDCILTSRGARNREMRRRGMFDKSGGYGDYCGK